MSCSCPIYPRSVSRSRHRAGEPRPTVPAHWPLARAGAADAASHPVTAAVVVRIVRELSRMAERLDRPYLSSPFVDVLGLAWEFLSAVAGHLQRGAIVVPPSVRLCRDSPPPEGAAREVRLGVFPVNGNPLHWGHLLCALEAMAVLRLDQVAFVVQGVDARKPLAGRRTQQDRHRMARQVVGLLAPLAAYSDVGLGSSRVGEDNLFELLRLNPDVPIVAHYIVGADHYRLCDTTGRPDTLPRLERNMADPAVEFDRSRHEIRVVFVERGPREERVPTRLQVDFLPETIHSSSTAVREGNLALTPHRVVRYLGSHPSYAAAIGFDR